jgi:lambda repressor-like predicted transcriptional regulator
MFLLQRLLKLKKTTASDIARQTGLGYDTVVKTIRGDRTSKTVREVIAKHLGIPYSHLWGKDSDKHLAKLIMQEIDADLQLQRRRMVGRFLHDENSLTNQQAVGNG